MSKSVLTNALIMAGELSLAGSSNSVDLSYAADEKEATTLADDTHIMQGGLFTVALGVGGFFEAPAPDSNLFSMVGVSGKPVTVAQNTTEGGACYFFNSLVGQYQPMEGSIGDLLTFQLGAAAQGNLIRGTLMVNGTKTATANGTGRQLGALTAAQKMHAALHVFSAAGTSPTLDVDVESDDNSGFTSAVTRASFAQKTAVGSEYLTVDGAITDDWWRIAFTIGGTSPEFGFAVSLGIN